LLAKEFSNPSGSVNVETAQYIGYTYDTMKSGDLFTKRLQLAAMKYPSGKTLTYDYDAIGNVTNEFIGFDVFSRWLYESRKVGQKQCLVPDYSCVPALTTWFIPLVPIVVDKESIVKQQ